MLGFKKRWIAVMMILCSIIGGTGSLTVYGAAKQAEGRIIRIGYIDYEGFITETEDGDYTGYGVEYLRKIARYTGWEYEYSYDSWSNQLEKLKSGEIDFLCNAQKTPEREAEYLFSKYPVGSEASVLYVRADDERYYYNDYEAYDGMTVAVMEGSSQNTEFAEYAQRKGFSYTTVTFATQEECFAALSEERVDAAAVGSLALNTEYKAVCRFGSDPLYFISGSQNQELMEELDEALGQISSSDASFQSELYQKYYGERRAESSIAFTREEAEYIKNAGTIQIACIPSRQPFSFVNDQGEIDGITSDILKLLSEQSGLTFEYVMMPEGMRAAEYLEQYPDALVAGILADNPTFANQPYLLTDSFYTDDVALASLYGKEYDLDAEEASYRLAVPRSYIALEEYIEKNYPQFEVVECNTTQECLDMVEDGSVDFMAQNVNVIKYYLADPHNESITVLPAFFMEESMGIVSLDSEEHRLLTEILNKCIATLTTKELEQFTVNQTLANRYTLGWEDVMYKFRYPFLMIGVLFLAVIVLLFAFEIMRRRNYHRLEEKNGQLALAVSQANSANEAKSQFLARMSHEIRTPMNAIVGLTQLAKNRTDEPEQIEDCLDKIETSSALLLNIINDVLDMSAIESHKLKIAQSPFSLEELLDSLEAVYSAQCRQKGIVFVMEKRELGDGRLIGDALRLNQILLNLISNAYKFTPEGGSITVTAQRLPEQNDMTYYKFVVADSGEGISGEMQERLFKPFEQEEADTARHHGGSGLGLSITKNLVELMGGSISCQSKKGEGTTFIVSLPFKSAVKEAEEVHKEGEEETFDFGGRRILLAEDTGMSAAIMTDLLGIVNLGVEHAWNGKEAVELFEKSEPGTYMAILMDVRMPVMNGYEAARAIRALPKEEAAGIPIYAMTANAFTEDVSASLNAGMNGHIAKPVDTKALYRLLKKIMEENG